MLLVKVYVHTHTSCAPLLSSSHWHYIYLYILYKETFTKIYDDVIVPIRIYDLYTHILLSIYIIIHIYVCICATAFVLMGI